MADDPKDPPTNVDPPAGGKTFTQAELDAAIGARLAKEREKFKDYDALKGKADKFDQLDAASKSDIEKAGERAAAAEKRAEEAERRALRLEVATRKGLTEAMAKRLNGATKEELEADADELLETFKPTGDGGKGTPPPGGKPRENLAGGSDPTVEVEVTDPRKLAEMVPRQ